MPSAARRTSPCAHPLCTRLTKGYYCWQHVNAASSVPSASRILLDPPLSQPYGSTPIPADLAADLVSGIDPETLQEIDERERAGLARMASDLLWRSKEDGGHFLWDDVEFLAAHRTAFADTWKWGGQYRSREMNLGIDPTQIATQMRILFGNAQSWRELGTHSAVEQVIRLHCEVGRIHPFVNGNGRVSRVYCEVMLFALDPDAELGWSRSRFPEAKERRRVYIEAVRQADATGDYSAVIDFASHS